MRTGDEKAEIGRQGRNQIDDAVEAEGVSERSFDGDETKEILDRKQDRQCPFDEQKLRSEDFANTP